MKHALIHPHARARMIERGVSEVEVRDTLEHYEYMHSQDGRQLYQREFAPDNQPRKQVRVYATRLGQQMIIFSVMAQLA